MHAPVVRIDIPVSGMTCAACQARVQRTLVRQHGVHDAAVNLMTRTASITYDPAEASPQEFVDAIRTTGYGADLPLDRSILDEQEAADRAYAAEYRALATKAVLTLVAGFVAMIVSMPLMAPAGHEGIPGTSDPFMRWVSHSLAPIVQRATPWLYSIDTRVLSFALLATTAAIMAWSGRAFYVRAWAAFRHRAADMNTLIAVGTGAAFLFSAAATVAPSFFVARGVAADTYYEAVIFIIGLVLAGRAIEARARAKTSEALRKLASLLPSTARVDEGGVWVDIRGHRAQHSSKPRSRLKVARQ